ncbi:hypothetical protein MD484_g6549, partial [Candolleomyces efflorescens]
MSSSSHPGIPGPSMSFFQNARDFRMGKVQVNNIEGNYTDRRSYRTVNDYSTNNSTVYHQENSRGPIYNGNINGGVNTFTGGSVSYGFGRSYSSPSHGPSQKKKKKSTRPPGTYYQQNAQGPLYNGDIEGGVNSFHNTTVNYHGQESNSDSDGYDSYERNDDPSYFQEKPWSPHGGAHRNHRPPGGSPYGGQGGFHPQDFEGQMVVDDPVEYPSPSSEDASQYPESYNPPRNVGSSASRRAPSFPESRRAGTWAPSSHVNSPPPTVYAVPPSAPASSRGMRSPQSDASRLAPINEGRRSVSPSFANAYPSPAPSQEERPFFAQRTKSKKVDVSDELQNLSLDDQVEQTQSPTQFPLTPPESAPQTPFPPSLGSKNPFRAHLAAQQAHDRRQTFN